MRIYNTLTRRKEELVPLVPGQIGLYVCGPTVYNYFHIGNARPFVLFDVLRRYLEHRGFQVTFVQNITDIDDKMIARAKEEGVTVCELGERFTAAYFEDAKALGIRPATMHPKATEHIGDIVALIETLVTKGFAYASQGDVYFDTQAYPDYGKLCGQDLSDLESGARVDVTDLKRNARDFALWKAQKPGEPAWDSPWGLGRPGWHIECSAMSMRYLGETFDIHCGGQDLLFPHHENELAQSEAATGKPFARHWMHNGFLNIDGEKMSKSLNNFFTVRDIGQEFDLEAVRMFLLGAHYRSPLNFSRDQIQQAASALERLYIARDNLAFLAQRAPMAEAPAAFLATLDELTRRFEEAMDDDLNTADALGVLFELVRVIHGELNADSPRPAVDAAAKTFETLCSILGLVSKAAGGLPEGAQALLDARAEARKARQWQESDRLRAELASLGVQVEDTPQGQKWRIV